jgi:Bifunctional DNA primase/polymerase, N-terminal
LLQKYEAILQHVEVKNGFEKHMESNIKNVNEMTSQALGHASVQEAAKYYSLLGIVTHPLKEGKKPILSKWNRLIETPFGKIKLDDNLGFICGQVSDLTVIDVDWYVKGIWDEILQGVDDSEFIKQSHTEGKYHLLFRYCKNLKAGLHQPIGFDILSDLTKYNESTNDFYIVGNNCVAAPSVHADGNQYVIDKYIENRHQVPEIVVTRINNVISTYDDLTKKIISKCRKVFQELWKEVFIKTKGDHYHKFPIYRNNILALMAELKANGASHVQLHLVCMLIFGNNYDCQKSEDEIKQIDDHMTATTETLLADPYFSQFMKVKDEPKAKAPAKEVKIRKAYIITDDRIYLTVIDKRGNLEFAWLEGDEVQFAESVEIDGDTIYTNLLPTTLEKSKKVLSIPSKEDLVKAVNLSASDLFEQIKAHMKKYLYAKDTDYDLFIYFILLTWFYEKGDTVPYERFIGDLGMGKTRYMDVNGDLCFYTVTATGNSSLAGIMRINESWHGTMRVDEADISGDESDKITTYFNCGFQRGKVTIKANTNPNTKSDIDVYEPYCPKLLGMRKPFRDMALESRCLSYDMLPISDEAKDRIPVELPPEYKREVEKLKGVIARFVMKNWNILDVNKRIQYNSSDLDIEPRLKQLIYPLSIILQLFPDGEEKLKNCMKSRQIEFTQTRSTSFDGTLFYHLLSLVRYEKRPYEFEEYYIDNVLQAITPTMMASLAGNTPKTITTALHGMGISVEQGRVELKSGKAQNVRKYVFDSPEMWTQVYERYYVPEPDEEPITECPIMLRSKKFKSCSTS